MKDIVQNVVKPETLEARKEFYHRLAGKNTVPFWEVLSDLIFTEPRPACVPSLWKYDELRSLLMEAGEIITAREAERRVLVLENPGLRGTSQITQSLYAGLQLIMPGEEAVTHRHTASALRFIIEGEVAAGEGAYTAVDGERTTMRAGDFIITPSWTFHDHGNPGDRPVVWMDGLDIPIVNSFDTSFFEPHKDEIQPVIRKQGDALARYGANLLPVNYKRLGAAPPLLNYPYARSREALEQLSRNGPVDAYHGIKMQYIDPTTGSYPMATIAAFLQLLPAGFHGAAYRSTDATIYCVAEGRGRSRIGDASFTWQAHDIFVAPSWRSVSHEAAEEAVLFSFSDRASQQALGLWREELIPL